MLSTTILLLRHLINNFIALLKTAVTPEWYLKSILMGEELSKSKPNTENNPDFLVNHVRQDYRSCIPIAESKVELKMTVFILAIV